MEVITMKSKKQLLSLLLTGIIAISAVMPVAASDAGYYDALATTQYADDSDLEPMVVSAYREYGAKLNDLGKTLYYKMYDKFDSAYTDSFTYTFDSNAKPTSSELSSVKQI
jgi:hypothetical protein